MIPASWETDTGRGREFCLEGIILAQEERNGMHGTVFNF